MRKILTLPTFRFITRKLEREKWHVRPSVVLAVLGLILALSFYLSPSFQQLIVGGVSSEKDTNTIQEGF